MSARASRGFCASPTGWDPLKLPHMLCRRCRAKQNHALQRYPPPAGSQSPPGESKGIPCLPLEHKGILSICWAYVLYLRCLDGAWLTGEVPRWLLMSDEFITSSQPRSGIPASWARQAHSRCGHPPPASPETCFK